MNFGRARTEKTALAPTVRHAHTMNRGGDGDGRLLWQQTGERRHAGGRNRADDYWRADVPDIRAPMGMDLRAGYMPDQRGLPDVALRRLKA